jgi:hypothetical protein
LFRRLSSVALTVAKLKNTQAEELVRGAGLLDEKAK